MIRSLFPSFLEHAVAGSILFLLFLLLFGSLFSKGDLLSFLHGMLRVIASAVYSPFVFLRRATIAVMRFARRGEKDYAQSEQYLLNKLLLWWHAVVIVVAIAWLSISAVLSWIAFLPPSEVTSALEASRMRLNDEQQRLTSAAAEVSRYDTDWTTRRQQLITAWRSQREQTSRDATRQNAQIDNEIRASGNLAAINILIAMGNYVRSQAPASSNRINSVRQDLDRYVYGQYYSLDDASRPKLNTWISNWARGAQARVESDNLSEEALRSEAQPDYRNALSRKSSLEEAVASA